MSLVFLYLLADGAESSTVESKSQIDKAILKDLIEQKVLYRHQVIRLVAEICKQGQKQISTLAVHPLFLLRMIETERKECVKLDFIPLLKEPLQAGDIQEKIESCRALGNMCYENGSSIKSHWQELFI